MFVQRLIYVWLGAVLVLMSKNITARAENWPTWHGPRANAVTADRNLPLTWSRTENIKWKVPLPAPGNSTPVIWNEHVFLTQAFEDGKRRGILAFDRSSGR